MGYMSELKRVGLCNGKTFEYVVRGKTAGDGDCLFHTFTFMCGLTAEQLRQNILPDYLALVTARRSITLGRRSVVDGLVDHNRIRALTGIARQIVHVRPDDRQRDHRLVATTGDAFSHDVAALVDELDRHDAEMASSNEDVFEEFDVDTYILGQYLFFMGKSASNLTMEGHDVPASEKGLWGDDLALEALWEYFSTEHDVAILLIVDGRLHDENIRKYLLPEWEKARCIFSIELTSNNGHYQPVELVDDPRPRNDRRVLLKKECLPDSVAEFIRCVTANTANLGATGSTTDCDACQNIFS